ncbi:MAG: hypothetical protein KatS3mg068_2006 [Candidatus Sericytochromatia bacterium]|nr:MAG: hypothetical protein KatS3mg068_2006 [Candidatus Sericytochromatia bacterium]
MKKLFLTIFLLSLSINSQAQERNGNSTILHVNNYGKNSNIKEGTYAENFTAYDTKGNKISLSDFKNKKNVLLVFYPGDDTPGCTKQLCDIRDDYKELQKLDIVVFGVNPADKDSHKKFINKNNFPFELLIDENKNIAKNYDAIGMFGFINRTVVLINKKGKIVLYKRGMPDLKPEEISKLL